MMKKYALNLPRLKLGPKTARDNLEDGLDSPPPTPKSVRPPLSPRTDYELRTACALIIQEYTSPTRGDDEQYLNFHDASLRADYEAIMRAMDDDSMDDDVGIEIPPLEPVNTLAQPRRTNTAQDLDVEDVSDEEEGRQSPIREVIYEDGEVESINTPREDAAEPAVQLATSTRLVARSPSIVKVHKRSASNPVNSITTAMKSDPIERPRTALGSDSMMTTASSTKTDGTDYGWSASTAPTTAAITPAHASKPTSCHATQSNSANDNDSHLLAGDAEWMRVELEKFRKAQEEVRAQQELEDQVAASLAIAAHLRATIRPSETVHVPTPASQVPARKPAPIQNTDSSSVASNLQNAESRQSVELRRSLSRRRRSTPRSESRHELEMLQPENKLARAESRAASRTASQVRKAARETKDASELNATNVNPKQDVDESRPPTRSRSITRQFRSFIRSTSRSSYRKMSIDISRPESRGRSVDSYRSAVSAVSSVDPSKSKWRGWMPFHRNRDSTTTVEASTPSSSISYAKEDTYTNAIPQSSPQPKPKPPINLNRELPPLPSLDQWKDDDVEEVPPMPSKPQHILEPGALKNNDGVAQDKIRSSTSPQSQNTSADSPSSQRPRDSVLNDSQSQLRNHLNRASSTGAPTNPSKDPVPTQDVNPHSPPTSPGFLTEMTQRLDSVGNDQSKYSLELDDPTTSSGVTRPLHSGKAHIVHYTRTKNWPTGKTGIGRRASENVYTTTNTSNATVDRSHTDQGLNFSHKLSSDDYTRSTDLTYQNTVQLPAKPVEDEKPLPLTPKEKEKAKKKWWRSSVQKMKEKTWMDHVVKSGSKTGIITDQTAGGPVARY